MSHISDFTQPEQKILLDLVNDANGTAFTFDELEVTFLSQGAGEAANVVVTAKEISGYGGSVTASYRRLNIADFVGIYYPEGIQVLQGEGATLSDYLPAINLTMATALGADNVIDVALGPWAGEPNEIKTVTLQIKPTSMVYYGSVNIGVKANDIPLNTVVTSLILSGLNMPIFNPPGTYTRFSLSGASGSADVPAEFIEWRVDEGDWNNNGLITIPSSSSVLDIRNKVAGSKLTGSSLVGLPITGIVEFQMDLEPAINFVKNSSFVSVPAVLPEHVTDLRSIFQGASSFNQDISGWDVSHVDNFSNAFSGCTAFNKNLSDWSIKRGSIDTLFDNATPNWQEHNKPIFIDPTYTRYSFTGTAGTSNVSYPAAIPGLSWRINNGAWSTARLFIPTGTVLKTLDLRWNSAAPMLTNSLTNLSQYFKLKGIRWFQENFHPVIAGIAKSYDFTEVPKYLPPAATHLDGIFLAAHNFNNPNVRQWDTSKVVSMRSAFQQTSAFNQDISGWNISKVRDMRSAFHHATAFNQNLSSWNFTDITTSMRLNWDYNTPSWTLPKPTFS